MAAMGVAEAAGRLGVTPRRVRQMISELTLPAHRVGPVWAIDERDLDAVRRQPAHRPWKPESAWAVLAAAGGSELASLSASQRHRARRRLGAGLANIVPLLAGRCRRRTFYAHPGDLDRIIETDGVVRTAASAAAELGVDLIGPGPPEAYAASSVLANITALFHIEERSERPNLVLREVDDAHWPFPDGTVVVSSAVAAADLLESSDERARRAGATLLASL